MTLLDLLSRTSPARKPYRPLASALDELDIQPFDHTSVEMYKAAKKVAVGDAFLAKLQTEKYVTHVIPDDPDFNPDWREGKVSRYEAEGLEAQAHGRGYDARFFYPKNGGAYPVVLYLRWRRMSLQDFKNTGGNVPEYVERKAAQVAAKVPDAVQIRTRERRLSLR